MSMLSRNIILLSIAVVIASGVYSFYYHDRPRVDAKAYDRIAQNLAEGYGYIEHRANADHPEQDDAIVRLGPGYQFFLAGIYKIFGHQIWAVWIIHALLRGASVILLFLITKKLFPDSDVIPLAASFLFGFSPDLIVVNGLLLTETLFLFLLILSVYTTLTALEGERVRLRIVALAGIFWSLCILTRPVALLPLLLICVLFIWRRQWKEVTIFLLGAILLIAPWSVFMSLRYDTFILTTTAGGLDIWVGNNPQAAGGFTKTPEIQAVRDNLHSVAFTRLALQKYKEFLVQDPLSFLELQWRKTSIYFSLMRPTGFWVHLAAYPWDRLVTLLASGLWTAGLFVGGIAGAFLVLREKWNSSAIRLLFGFAILQPLAVIPLIVETRYRYALFPFLAIFAAYWFYTRPFRWKALKVALGILIIFTAYDAWYNWIEIMSKVKQALPLN